MDRTETSPVSMERRDTDAGRLFSPSAARNKVAIAEVLREHLKPDCRVLEIGSGTGEHAVAACSLRPDLDWQPSDPDLQSRNSQAAWAAHSGAAIRPPLDLNLLKPDWFEAPDKFGAIVCSNVIHISPWAVAENLARGAAQILDADGVVCLYGPFLEGADTAPSNLDFDRSLQARNPEWGVRALAQVDALFGDYGFARRARIEMPANNLSLVFQQEDD